MTRAEKKQALADRNKVRQMRWIEIVLAATRRGVAFMDAMREAERDVSHEMLEAPGRGEEILDAWHDFVKSVKRSVSDTVRDREVQGP